MREALAHRYEVEEAENGTGALELLTSIGDFDVAIVDLCRSSAAHLDEALIGTAAIRALHKAQPSLGIVAHGAACQSSTPRPRRSAPARRHTSSRARPWSRSATRSTPRPNPSASSTRSPRASRGRPALTRRQREILQLYADGNSTARVARDLGLSAETVRTHTKGILARLQARDRAHAVAIALRTSLIE